MAISSDAISGESILVAELGYLMDPSSLRFGIVEGLGLGLGQDCGRAVGESGSLLEQMADIFAEQSAAAREVTIS